MGCGYCCQDNSLPVFYFLPSVTGWFSFLLQGRLGPDMVIDQQPSGRDQRAVQKAQRLRCTTHACTHARSLTVPERIPPTKPCFVIHAIKSFLHRSTLKSLYGSKATFNWRKIWATLKSLTSLNWEIDTPERRRFRPTLKAYISWYDEYY